VYLEAAVNARDRPCLAGHPGLWAHALLGAGGRLRATAGRGRS